MYPASGLNHWNAKGRKRSEDECYIPFPAVVRNRYPNFFPSKGIEFKLRLPNGEILSVKICQEGGKALMSNPNEALGKWILRDVLRIKPGETVTIEDLDRLDIDSVRIDKIPMLFEINFQNRFV